MIVQRMYIIDGRQICSKAAKPCCTSCTRYALEKLSKIISFLSSIDYYPPVFLIVCIFNMQLLLFLVFLAYFVSDFYLWVLLSLGLRGGSLSAHWDQFGFLWDCVQ